MMRLGKLRFLLLPPSEHVRSIVVVSDFVGVLCRHKQIDDWKIVSRIRP